MITIPPTAPTTAPTIVPTGVPESWGSAATPPVLLGEELGEELAPDLVALESALRTRLPCETNGLELDELANPERVADAELCACSAFSGSVRLPHVLFLAAVHALLSSSFVDPDIQLAYQN